MASVFVQWLHAHIGLITCDVVLKNLFLTIKKLLPIYHDWKTSDCMHINIKDFWKSHLTYNIKWRPHKIIFFCKLSKLFKYNKYQLTKRLLEEKLKGFFGVSQENVVHWISNSNKITRFLSLSVVDYCIIIIHKVFTCDSTQWVFNSDDLILQVLKAIAYRF